VDKAVALLRRSFEIAVQQRNRAGHKAS
jgi:hypothetical protein